MDNFKFHGNAKIITSGRGDFFFDDGSKKEGEFKVAQRDDAALLFKAQITKLESDVFDSFSTVNKKAKLTKISGHDESEKKVILTDLISLDVNNKWHYVKGSNKVISGNVGTCEIGTKELKPEYKMRFGLLNFLFEGKKGDSILKLDFPEISFTIKPTQEYEQLKQILKYQKGVHFTAEMEIEVVEGLTLDKVYKYAHKLRRILSVARSTWITWANVEIAKKDDEKVYELYGDALTRNYHGPSLIDENFSDTTKFIKTAWQSFDDNEKVFNLSRFISAYVDTFSNTFIETRGLLIAVLGEYLSSKWADHKGITHNMDPKEFDKKIIELRGKIRPILEEVFSGIEPSIIDAMVGKTKGFNNVSLRRKMKDLVDDFNIPIKNKEISKFLDSRNLLAHEASYPNGNEEADLFFFLRHFLDRIVLSVLGYSGNYFDMENMEERTLISN